MSSNVIDERVLSMKFDNKQFESGVSTTMSTLEKLKQKLNLKGATDGLENVATAAKNINFSGLSSGIETVQARFSALQVVAMTAISNITNSVMNLGRKLVSAVTVDPIRDGFKEYETQMNAVQTILANTQKEGTNVKVVNAALDELNHYADKTIYNFTEMTRNIGTFTAAGVKLNTSVSSIKGIANLAAVSGSTSQQASTAMYQLSQAIAAGTVKLMDWNSVVNAGMGGQVFQDALVRTSKHLKTGAEAAIKAKGSFRESLATGWLTTEVLTQTLDQFATAAETQEEYQAAVKKFVDQGYSKEEATQMADMAKTANEAATKVKTFTQLIDTLKEALGSGWTESWRTIIGDFEEARTMWTEVSDVLNDAINKSSDARNKMLTEWADKGGRTALIDSVKNIAKGIVSIVTPIKEAFRDIFPAMTSKQLLAITEGFKELTAKIKISDETADKLKRTFTGLFSIADMVKKAFELVGNAIGKVFSSGAFGSVVDIILSITAAIGDMFTALNKGFDTSGVSAAISKMVSGIASVLESAASHISSFSDILSTAGQGISKALNSIWDGFTKVFTWITDNVSTGDILAGIIGGGTIKSVKSFTNLFDSFKDAVDSVFGGDKTPKLASKISAFLGEISTALKAFTTGVKTSSLVAIAGALGILAASLRSIAELKAEDITKSVIAIGAMFLMLNRSFKFISDAISSFKGKGLIKAGVAMVAMATSIKILSNALVKISELNVEQMAHSLITLGLAMKILTSGVNKVSWSNVTLSTSVAMLALAESCKILGDALQKFSGLSWDEIGRGLTAMGGALAEFVIAIRALDKLSGFKSIAAGASLLIAVQSLSKMAEGLKSFAGMSWDEISIGLGGMGYALTELTLAIGILGKFTGFDSVLGATAILIAVQSLDEIADALQSIGSMSWDEISKGLGGMGYALTELSLATGILGKTTGFDGLLGATSILIAVQSLDEIAEALESIGNMSWDEISNGLGGMGYALTELSLAAGILGKTTGFDGLLGAASIVVAVQSLDEIAEALQDIGSMSWEDIGKGLAGLGGALTELSLASGLLGGLTGLLGLIGAGSLVLAVQGLGDLADALKKFGEMSWDEIQRGLSAMEDALGTIALGGLMNTLSGLGAGAIAEVAKPLGDLADSVKKWADVNVPDNLGDMLTQLAEGIFEFTFDGLGAATIATLAGPLGTLAASVNQWQGVSVPDNIQDQLKSIAKGVGAFWADGLGASAIATLATPLGTLASSVQAWSGVTVPEGLEGALTGIAKGVESFSFLFIAGWSLSTLTGPLADLAASVQAWNGVTVPEGIGDILANIATGISAFSFLFIAGWSLSTLTGPLADLAESVKKWGEVGNLPNNIGEILGNVADGLKKFTWLFVAGWSLSSITGPLGDLVPAIKKLEGLNIPSDLPDQLQKVADGIKKFTNLGDIQAGVDATSSLADSIKALGGVDYSSVATGLGTLGTAFGDFANSAKSLSGVGETIVNNLVTPIKNAASQLQSVGADITNSIATGINNGAGAVSSAMTGVMTKVTSAIKSKSGEFRTSGAELSKKLASGVKSGKSEVTSSVTSLVSNASSKLRSYYTSFSSAGSYLAQGFANGIKSGSFAATIAASAMAQAAANAARKKLDEHSPSKVGFKIGDFFGAGFTNGIINKFKAAKQVGSNMAESAKTGLISALSGMSNLLDLDINTQPVITPVVDLSNVTSGASTINDLLGTTQTIGAMSNLKAINAAMKLNQNNQNEDVVNAINKLRKDLGNIGGDTYSINGVYASDDDIVDAIKTIVRAVKVERRV